jgi:hypothetical protein
MTVQELNHGDLKVKLLLCNKALRLATLSTTESLGRDESVIFSGGQMVLGEFLYSYAYFCYKMYCQKHREQAFYDEFDFDEAIREQVLAENSNLDEVLTSLSDSLIATVTKNVEQVKAEKKTSVSDGQNLKPSIVEG